MNNLLKSEQAAQLALAILALYLQPIHIAWWLWLFLFLSPDIGMAGYLMNNQVGAWVYNFFHHRGVAAIVIFAGYFLHVPWVLLIGLVLFAHSAFDRMLGYGLKYPDGFAHTHLGYVGKGANPPVGE